MDPLPNVPQKVAGLVQDTWSLAGAPAILLAYFASLPWDHPGAGSGMHSPTAPWALSTAVATSTTIVVHIAWALCPLLPGNVARLAWGTARVLAPLLHCLLEVCLLLIFCQGITSARDSPMYLPTEFLYAPPLVVSFFVLQAGQERTPQHGPDRQNGRGAVARAALALSSFLQVATILTAPPGSKRPYPVEAHKSLSLVVLLAIVHALPAPRGGEDGPRRRATLSGDRLVHIASSAAIKSFSLLVLAAAFALRVGVHHGAPSGGKMRDFYSLRMVTSSDRLDHTEGSASQQGSVVSSIATTHLRLHLVVTSAVWFSSARMLSRDAQARVPDMHRDGVRELQILVSLALVSLAILGVSREHDMNATVGYTPAGEHVLHSMGVLWSVVIAVGLAAAIALLATVSSVVASARRGAH